MSMELILLGTMVLFTTHTDVELSVWIGVGGCGQPILIRVWRMGTISLESIKRPPSLALAAKDIKK